MRAPIRALPSYETLHQLLTYSPRTGRLIWKSRDPTTKKGKAFNTKFAGKPAGCVCAGRQDGSNRYLRVGFRIGKFQQYSAHRVIYKMMTGDEPPERLDHHDGDELNNKWNNLRPSTNGENLQNAKLRKDNKSGVKGVCWDAYHSKWKATIAANGIYHQLGRFDTVSAAAKVVEAARLKLHGEFARSK